MLDLSCFTESTAVLKISRYFRRQISYCSRKNDIIYIFRKRKKAFVPFMSDLSCFTENTAVLKISRKQEANILLLPENMILFLLVKRARRLLSHVCQISLALLKVQQF
jgi:hypothetical protein